MLPAGALVRLPTEAEWERAARLGSSRRFPWGNRWDPELANTTEGQVLRTTPVGAYPQGASAAGVQDFAGNGLGVVREPLSRLSDPTRGWARRSGGGGAPRGARRVLAL